MAKRDRVLPARKPRDRARDDASLIRSAETLGRTIGSLQRQLDGANRRLSETAADVADYLPAVPLGGGSEARRRGAKKKSKKTSNPAARKRTTRTSASPTRKGASTSRTRATTRSAKKR